jgi:hypothetical protein
VASGRATRPRKGHPALRGLEVGVWHPEGVGKVPGYGATPEAYEANRLQLAANAAAARAAGRLTRRDVPNGWAGKKDEVEAIRRNATTEAEMLADEPLPGESLDDQYAREALTFLLSLVVDLTQATSTRLRCARIVLPYLLSPPSRKVAIGSSKDGGMAFLMGLAAHHRGTEGKD